MATERLKISPSDYHRWAFMRVQNTEGSESKAFAYIMNRWLSQDRDEASREFGISREAFERETGGNLRHLPDAAKKPRGRPGMAD